jgi:transcriptional regulator with XRE-family HTH domain
MGEELRGVRERAGMTQEQVSFRAGLSRPYISQLERNLKSPIIDTLFRICDALDVCPSLLLGVVHSDRRSPVSGARAKIVHLAGR